MDSARRLTCGSGEARDATIHDCGLASARVCVCPRNPHRDCIRRHPGVAHYPAATIGKRDANPSGRIRRYGTTRESRPGACTMRSRPHIPTIASHGSGFSPFERGHFELVVAGNPLSQTWRVAIVQRGAEPPAFSAGSRRGGRGSISFPCEQRLYGGTRSNWIPDRAWGGDKRRHAGVFPRHGYRFHRLSSPDATSPQASRFILNRL